VAPKSEVLRACPFPPWIAAPNSIGRTRASPTEAA
jgi:hypothetical protein